MHLEGRNEVENRNGASAMKVASLGCRAKMRAKEEGKIRKSRVSFRREREYTKENANEYRSGCELS